MRNIDLQLFNAAVKGDKLIYLYRILEDAATDTAQTIMFSTEDVLTISKDSETTKTKDGTIRTPGEAEIEKTGTSILAVGDTMYDKLKAAMLDDKIIELWETNLAEPIDGEDNKFKGTYYQGYLTEFEKSSSAEDHVECSTTIGIIGKGADGEVTVTAAQQEVASYVFKDTTAAGA